MINNISKTIKLTKGEVEVFDMGDAKLHAYKTNDPMSDEVFILEKGGRGLVIESPNFTDNVVELSDYVHSLAARIEAKVIPYHNAGGGFLPDVSVYATRNADEFAHSGAGLGMVDGFGQAFGAAFDTSMHTVTNVIDPGKLEIAGFSLNIVPTRDAFDIEIPELTATYIHMLGHDYHSIVAGDADVDNQIVRLNEILASGTDVILSSHHTPENSMDLRTKLDYLHTLKTLAARNHSADALKRMMQQRFPTYEGENYLDMTVGMFFPA